MLQAQINKTDRNDARGMAQMMRAGLYRPAHVKTLRRQKLRMPLTHRRAQPSSLELQPDHAHEPVRHLLVAFELGGVRDQELAVIKIDQRFVIEHDPGEFLVDRLAPRRIGDQTRIFERLVGFGVGIAAVVLRCAGVHKDVGIAIGIDPAAPADQERLEFTGLGLLEGGR